MQKFLDMVAEKMVRSGRPTEWQTYLNKSIRQSEKELNMYEPVETRIRGQQKIAYWQKVT